MQVQKIGQDMKLIDISGGRFGRLLVICREGKAIPVKFKCICDCGKTVVVNSVSLRNGDTRSCGCIRSEKMAKEKTKHGQYDTPTYHSWSSMLNRCKCKKHKQYKDYGGRGISVCSRWRGSFEAFLSDMGERPGGKTLDRIDSDGNYEPTNCKWSTRQEQNRNKRTSRRITQ
jgi:hypothetical protein